MTILDIITEILRFCSFPTFPENDEMMDNYELYRWQHTIQSGILLLLFILWLIIGCFVSREVFLVLLDHHKIRQSRTKPLPKREYHGKYSVKKNRCLTKERNHQPNGLTSAADQP
ncbi:unnamed protein product [Caenorhabditis angaria]|uniref:Uncharacterized protein n=1 Tax=Caenorhabditis angaria TaxID=860376 RepID=A0A9P1J1Y5_9PELO|nr:unnamed protein product [Caenorhabditis angaria]